MIFDNYNNTNIFKMNFTSDELYTFLGKITNLKGYYVCENEFNVRYSGEIMYNILTKFYEINNNSQIELMLQRMKLNDMNNNYNNIINNSINNINNKQKIKKIKNENNNNKEKKAFPNENIMERLERDYEFNIAQATQKLTQPTIDEFENIARMMNSFIFKHNARKSGFKNLGDELPEFPIHDNITNYGFINPATANN